MWRKPSAMRCAYIRNVDDAGFLLMRCAHSPGTTRVLLANKIIAPLQTQKAKHNPKFYDDMGTFVRFMKLFFGIRLFLGIGGVEIDQTMSGSYSEPKGNSS